MTESNLLHGSATPLTIFYFYWPIHKISGMRRSTPSIYSVIKIVAISLVFSTRTCLAQVQSSALVGIESRYFHVESDIQTSIYTEPDWYWSSVSERQSVRIKPFARLDSLDDERSHFDLREFYWMYVSDFWEFRVGIDEVFWGVTESQHQVDIINQTDFVESIDGEAKLGQPMLKFSLKSDAAVLEAFILLGFRERTFAGPHGHFQFPLPVIDNDSIYESSARENHVDLAFRYAVVAGQLDLGISYFQGTNRDPKMVAVSNEKKGLVLVPYYDLMNQVGVDLQWTTGAWLWKLETALRHDSLERFAASTVGFEYTFFGLFDSSFDFGALIEVSRDSRGLSATTLAQKDIFFGGRLSLNDTQTSDLIVGVSQDLDYGGGRYGRVEFSRRINESMRLLINAWTLNSKNSEDFTFIFKDEDYFQAALEVFF